MKISSNMSIPSKRKQYDAPEQLDSGIVTPLIKSKRSSTFIDNLSLPIHRWFRYSAGFSAIWVREFIEKELKSNGRNRVLDPFAGSGTVLLEGEYCNIDAIGIEAHPFVARVARAKLLWRENPIDFADYAFSILDKSKKLKPNIERYSDLIRRCFSDEALTQLDKLRKAWQSKADGSPYSELTWFVIASILRECSHAGTAQWQYILPNKKKAKVANPIEAFSNKVAMFRDDMLLRQSYHTTAKGMLYEEDARSMDSVPNAWADLVITSPPYANNYDYADATRFEMSFFNQIEGWCDLQKVVRQKLVRSCTQHVASQRNQTNQILNNEILLPIRKEISKVCHKLDIVKEQHGGKKPYHTMIASYFLDLGKTWQSLRRVTQKGALVCFVVGDSAPYGIHAPVDRWLGELAVAAGFKSFRFEKIRDRNTKWKNRKHRVPLHEGYLWVEG